MTSSEVLPADRKPTATVWRNRIIGGLALVVVLVIAYFILAAFIPRWWAQRLAEMVNGSFSKGIGWGLFFGGLTTAISLFLLLFAVVVWRKRAGRFFAGAAVVVALLVAVPNLMTLTIVLGNSNAAHAGERILDVDAPAFRGAALVGALIAAAVFLVAVFFVTRRTLRRRKAEKQLEAGKPVTPPPAATAPETPAPRADQM
ncbi:permease [Nocardia puris]|uniref:Permease n=1 Tax=Nocardia puris TaxID=208602 RepID=A0A366DHB7_9NOCA|nr:permease [Nocardia puris]RBO89386.1 hypothetical protein DFR74_10763 [Nocardia puris]